MLKRVAVLLAAIGALATPTTAPLQGQRLPAQSFSATAQPAASPLSFNQNDYRWEGAIFGGAFAGITGVVIQAGACRRSDGQVGEDCTSDALMGGLVGAAAGAVLGYIIGSRISKG